MGSHELASKLGGVSALDGIAKPLAEAVHRRIGRGPLKDALSGTWLGHPVHPMLTDVPIGAFTSATILDVLGGRRGRRAADTLVVVGVAAALPTAAAGLADWSDTHGSEQRVGVVHAWANTAGVALYAASVPARLRGRRLKGTALGLLGLGVMGVGAYLGGYLSLGRGVGVNNAFWQELPEEWTPVLDVAELPEAKPVAVEADGASVLLFRSGGRILAIGDRCTHAGGPLHEGEVDERNECVTCPWHRSVFRLADGSVVHGPAAVPEPAYDVRIAGDKIEVRVRS